MTSPPLSPNPLGSDAPTTDYVGLAFVAMVFAVTVGTGVESTVALLVRTLQSQSSPSPAIDLGSAPALILLFGTLTGVLVAAVLTWQLLAPVRSAYRQGGLAIVSAFATLVVSMITVPIDLWLGRIGLLGLAVLCALSAAWLTRPLARRRLETREGPTIPAA